ncbi:MAG: DUF1573 domain-containing protein [Deltaproteobacteria bacterium]|nr:DUF1573 domain-containing protein [Deltaproteobacteria bacterium]MBW1962880.1 DUF1573 domain-containing protein [Deltaproteobacteria bacterium]MBW2150990.1 DUF1573 domain-containing protein [Deltaproteobacteria bacterium]
MKTRTLTILFAIGYLFFLAAGAGTASTENGSPEAFLPETRFEFEPVPEGTEVTHQFKIQNKGNAILRIHKVRTG